MNKFFKAIICLATAGLLAIPAQAAFRLTSSGRTFTSFQEACNYAANTDTIQLTSNMDMGGNAITLSKNITLTSQNGNYTLTRDNANGSITVPLHNTLTLANLTINGNNVAGNSALITVQGALVVNDGTTIRNVKGPTSKDGSAIVVDDADATVTMNGGTIGDCVSGSGKSGGAIFISAGTMTMNGGAIQNNTAEKTSGAIAVGAVGTSNVGKLYLRGGTIAGNACWNQRRGGGVCILNASSYVYVSGSVVVQGNSLKDGNGYGNVTAANDIDFHESANYTGHLVQDGNLTSSARIGVGYPASSPGGAQFGTANSGVTGSDAFFYDGNDAMVGGIKSSTQLVWTSKPATPVCRVVSNDRTYTSLEDAYAAAAATDEIQLLADITISYGSTMAIDKNITLTSDSGHTYTLKRGNAGCSISVPSGKRLTLASITVDGNELNGGDAFFVVQSGGTLTINDGATIQKCAKSTTDGSAIRVAGGTVTMNGGLITDNRAVSGGAILIGSGTMTVNGGTISGNTAGNEGGAIAVGTWNSTTDVAKLYLRGGSITGNTCGDSQNGGGGVSLQNSVSYIYASGSPVVQNNRKGTVPNDISFFNADWRTHLVQDGRLTSDARLGVAYPAGGTVNGVQFGTATSDVTGSSAFFYDGDATYAGMVESGRLVWAPADPVCRLVSNGRTYSSLEAAYAAAADTDEIQLLKDIALTQGSTMTLGKNLTLSSDPGHVYTLSRGNGGCAISVPSGKSLALANIVVDGADLEAASAMFRVENGGTFTVNAGATIRNCRNVSGNGGAVNAAGGATVNLAGGTITGCSAAAGGAVYLANSQSTTTTNVYKYYKVVFKKSGNGDFQLSELKLLDAKGNRINGGTYTVAAKNSDPSGLNVRQCVYITSANGHWDNEGPANLFDGSTGTKFAGPMGLTDANNSSSWLTLAFRLPDNAAPAAGYMFTTANDAADFSGRNPTAWSLYGSMNGTDWTELDSRSGVSGPKANFVDYASTPWPITGYRTTTTGSDASATLNVSGSPIVADNTVAGSSELSNIQPTAADQVKLAGAFGGNVGVSWPTTGEAEGAQFGVATVASGADGFFFDGDAETYQGVADGSTLVWETRPTDAVCRIGETTYTSLKLAVEAAHAGDTIVLLKDIVQKTDLVVDKKVTLDGAGHKISRGGANGALTIKAAVSMQNLMIDGARVPANGPMVSVTGEGSLALTDAVTVTKCANGGISASGPITVAGSTWITDNEGGSLCLAGSNLLSVAGPLTGTIDVAFPATVTEGVQFGTVTGAYTPTGADVRHFVCENDVTYRPTIEGSALKWTNKTSKYPADGSIEKILNDNRDEPVTVIEIGGSTGNGDDIVIPAGRDVIIDLKGNTLTMDVVANGNVTIIDSSPDKTGKLVGTLTENEGGDLTIEAGTFTQRPEEEWLAPNRIIVDNDDDTFTVVTLAGMSTVTGCTLDTRRGVRLVENPYADVLPLTYASSNWVFQASTNQSLKSYVAIADALPNPEGDFANAQWHDGMTNNVGTGPAGQGDRSYDYPTLGNRYIVEIAPQEQQYLGPNESEVVWQEWRYGLVQAVLTNEVGYLRAWYKFPDLNSNIVPVLPGDPAKVQDPDYSDPEDMNTPGNDDYPGYSVTNDVTRPWIVVPDPVNPYTPDPDDDTKVVTNYVAQTPNTANPAENEMELVIRVVGPGTLTWNDLIIDGSEQQDSRMTICIDDGDPITVHTGGMEDWDSQKVVYGGDTDTVHTVRIKFRGNSSGDTVNQANGFVDNVVWKPYVPVAYEQVKDDESLPFEFANLGTEPVDEHAGETHYYQNGADAYVILGTVSTVDENGKQLTSQTTNQVDQSATGTEDYWYAIQDPGPSNVAGNVIAQTAPTLGTNEVVVMHVTGIDGPSKFYWDMKIEEAGNPETPATLDVVIAKTYTDPTTGDKTVTVTTNHYTAAEIADWTHAYKPLAGEIGCTYDVDFIFTNNSDGSAVCKVDDIGWKRPDINIAPEMHDENDGKQPPNGSAYGADDKMRPDPTSDQNVNKKTDEYYPGYTLENESRNPWEVVPDPLGGDKASNPGKANDDVAQTPDSLGSGESTKITVTVEGDGELRWKSYIDDGDKSAETPATFIVIVDGKTNQVYTADHENAGWTDHVVHVLDNGVDGATHTVEIIYVQETSGNPDSTGYVDNFRFERSISNEQLQDTIVGTEPPSSSIEEERTKVTCTNEVDSGWMPYYDENGNLTGVRSGDGTEGTSNDEDLDSTFYVHVVGAGEIKVDRISVPVGEDPFDPDGGVLTIKVDGVEYPIPTEGDVSYSVVTNNGVVTISNLVIKVSVPGDTVLEHDVTFNYHRDAYDIDTNTEAIVERITWTPYPEPNSNIVPILPGDPEQEKTPSYPDPDDMNTPGDEDYPGYSVTNDVTNPWIVVPDPVNPYTPDPTDPTKVTTNYVAQTPITTDPVNNEMEVLIRVVGPGTLTWNDLILDGSEQNDSTMVIYIDDGDPIQVHKGGMTDWDSQKVVYGGDVDTVHTVRIKFKGNSSGDLYHQANGYIDDVVWDPYIPVAYEQVKDDESLPFEFANLGTEPKDEHAGETHYYQNGSDTYVILGTVSTVDENGKQLTSQTTNQVDQSATGTEDYWYAIQDPGPSNVTGNVIAQTAPTLGTNEVVVMHVTGIDGPSKFYWDMKIEEAGNPEKPATLDVVITKTYTDPTTGDKTVTVKTYTYTAAEIADWTHGYKPLAGEIGCTYDVDFIFTNNSDGSAVCKVDDIGWKRPDINIAPEMHDDGVQPPNGSAYGADDKQRPDPTSDQNVNRKTDEYYPGYTLENESRNPWEVVPDPKTGKEASDPDKANDDVAQTPDSLGSGESTKITVTVEGDGELRWKSFIDPGDGKDDGTPATFIVIVDGKTNQVYTTEHEKDGWTDHVVHVVDNGTDGATHTVEIVYVQETSGNPDSTGYVDNFRYEQSITNEQMQDTLVDTEPPSATIEAERTQITCTNEVDSGWMPYYDENGNLTGVRSGDGTEGVKDDEDLDSTFYVHVVGTGEIKIDRIVVPVEEDPFDPDGGVLTITVDDKVYKIPPPQDDDVSYSIVTNNGVVTISNLVIKVSGDSDLPHDVTFNYHRDANDIDGNTEAIVEHITWKTYGEDDKGGSSWLEGKALWIIDHEDPGDGWVYLAFEPELKAVDELVKWVQRSDANNMIRVKYGRTRKAADACQPVIAHLSDKPGHEVTPVKVWIKVSLKDVEQVTVVEPVGYWRIFIDGPAIKLSGSDEGGASLQGTTPGSKGPATEDEIISTNGAVSVNMFGILKMMRATTNTMIAVPWTWYSKLQRNAEDIPVKKLVKTTNLEVGDMLYAPIIDNDTYAAWTVVSNEVKDADGKVTVYNDWSAVQVVRVDNDGLGRLVFKSDDEDEDDDYTSSTRIARGNGLWLYRQKPVDANGDMRPFWLYGQSVTTEVTTVISAPTGDMTVRSTMVGNPYAQDIVLNSLDFQGPIDSGDRIKIHTLEGVNHDLVYVAGKGWREYTTKIVNGVKKSGYTYQTVIPAGMAFWYDRRGKTDLKIKWPSPDAE